MSAEIFLNVDGLFLSTCTLWLLLSCMFTDLCNRAKAESVYQGLSIEIDCYVGAVEAPRGTLKVYSLLERFDQLTATMLAQ